MKIFSPTRFHPLTRLLPLLKSGNVEEKHSSFGVGKKCILLNIIGKHISQIKTDEINARAHAIACAAHVAVDTDTRDPIGPPESGISFITIMPKITMKLTSYALTKNTYNS